MNKWFLIILGVFLACCIWMGRFTLISGGRDVYKLDRFTGNVIHLSYVTEREVAPAAPRTP